MLVSDDQAGILKLFFLTDCNANQEQILISLKNKSAEQDYVELIVRSPDQKKRGVVTRHKIYTEEVPEIGECTCERDADGDVVDEQGRDYGILPSGIPRCGKCRKIIPEKFR